MEELEAKQEERLLAKTRTKEGEHFWKFMKSSVCLDTGAMISILVASGSILVNIEKRKFKYRIGTDCGVTSTINENSKTQIEFDGRYDGKEILSGNAVYQECDRIIFQTKNYDDPDAKYRICISPIYFNDLKCAASLDYKNGFFASPLQSFDCHMNINSRYCVPNGDKLYVFLNLVEGKSISSTMFKFRVTAERVDEKLNIGAIVGGVIGGVLFLFVLIVIIIVVRRSKMRNARL